MMGPLCSASTAFLLGIVFLAPGTALAHGMNAAEMVPPMLTSTILAITSFWAVMLWPESKNKRLPAADQSGSMGPYMIDGIRIKRKPILRVIETGKPYLNDGNRTGRAADD